nr:hypothetical protein [Pseudomonas tolaasii]
MGEALRDSVLMQENVRETVEAKIDIFSRMDALAPMNRPGFSRYLASSLRNAFQTLPATAYC